MDGQHRGTPKISDVARKAGVSTATVSRALSHPDSVAPDTRRRVLEAVRELGYTPNAAARNLRAGKTRMVLVAVARLSNPFFIDVLRGITAELHRSGYGVIIGDLDGSEEFDAHLVDLALSGQLDGIILMATRVPGDNGRGLDACGLPIVCAVVQIEGLEVPHVVIDDVSAAETQVRHLVDRGHRRLAYLSGQPGNYNDVLRYGGVVAAAAAFGLPPVMRLEGDYTFAAGSRAALAYLDRPKAERPTGVIAASDEMAIGFMKSVSRHGVHVPADVSVVGFDGMEFANYSEPTLTTMRQPRRQMGVTAARMILKRIAEPDATVPSEIVQAELQIGASTAPPPAAG